MPNDISPYSSIRVIALCCTAVERDNDARHEHVIPISQFQLSAVLASRALIALCPVFLFFQSSLPASRRKRFSFITSPTRTYTASLAVAKLCENRCGAYLELPAARDM
jgi:hypothetical protein